MEEAINTIGRGVDDPHIHVLNGRAYLYASRDYSMAHATTRGLSQVGSRMAWARQNSGFWKAANRSR